MALIGAMLALGMAQFPPQEQTERTYTPPEIVARKLNKAEKKRQKRLRRNLLNDQRNNHE